MKFKNIVFCSPSMITGGAEYYNVRYAQYISENHMEYNVYYLEYVNGFAHKVLSNKSIKYLDYTPCGKTKIPENSVVCYPSNLLIKIDDMITYNEANTILITFLAHSRHLASFFMIGDYFRVCSETRKKMGEELRVMTDLGSLIFMDNLSHLKLSQQFLFEYRPITPVHVPIPVEKNGIDNILNRTVGDVIRFCWLGRLDKEKSRNIITYMNELEMLNKRYKVSLSIIGVGTMENRLKNKAKKYSYKISFIGEKRESELDSYIRNNVDIGLASGTSSIEFAVRKVPVIQEWVIDKIYNANVRETYHLLENTEKISYISDNSHVIEGQNKFKNIVDEIINNYRECSERSYAYALLRSLDNTGIEFVNAIYRLEKINIKNSFIHLRKVQIMARKSMRINTWMGKFHLGRLYIIICQLIGMKKVVI